MALALPMPLSLPDEPRGATGVTKLLRALARRAPAGCARRRPVARSSTALIVGGDANQRRFCETLLQALGLSVEVAGGCGPALKALARCSFGLVIVDGATHGLSDEFWNGVRELFAGRQAPQLYVITDHRGAKLEPAPQLVALRAMPRPVRALSLVEAAQRIR